MKPMSIEARIKAVVSDEMPLTGEACEHGWDRAVCVMKGCDNPYALEPIIEDAGAEIARLRSIMARAHNAIGSGRYSRAQVKEWLREGTDQDAAIAKGGAA